MSIHKFTIWTLVLLLATAFVSCTQTDDETCPVLSPPEKGMVDIAIQVAGQQISTPQTRHGIPTPGTVDETRVKTLHVFAFDAATGVRELHEMITISDDGATAIDAYTGNPHPLWNGTSHKLRVKLGSGEKDVCVVANWSVGTPSSPNGFDPIQYIGTTIEALHTVVRSHGQTIGLPQNPPVMCYVERVTIADNQQEIMADLQRQIVRIDLYPAISTNILNSGVEVKINGVKFGNIANASYLTPHTNGGQPVSPPNLSLWEEGAFGGIPMSNPITITNPATASEADKFGTFYLPEHIATGEASATEMIMEVSYGGAMYYYGVKLHNGMTGADKRYWVERNHWYRYNVTITGRGSTDPAKPNYTNVQVGLRNNDWNGGESTTPDVGFELPHSSIEVMHFKGICRFILNTDREYGVSTDKDWLSARRITEGSPANARTYLEIMTRTNTTGADRTGTITVMLPNGLEQTLQVKQLSELNSLWINATDGTTWYRANLGAARMEDPGFFYQWGRNVAYSPYTPIAGVGVSFIDKLISYGAVNWSETPQIFPQSLPVDTWNSQQSTDVEWKTENDPCPSGYAVPLSIQIHSLFNGIWYDNAALGSNGYHGWWLDGTTQSTVGNGLFLLAYYAGRTLAEGLLRTGTGQWWWARNRASGAPALMGVAPPAEWYSGHQGGNPGNWGMSVRCVRLGNVRYDAGAPDATGTMTDSRFYGVGEEVLPLATTFAREGYRQSGWQVLGSNGNEVVPLLPLTGTTFNFPSNNDYVTLRAVWIKQFTNKWYNNGVLIATDTGDIGSEYVVPNAPSNPDPTWKTWGCWRNRGDDSGAGSDVYEHHSGLRYNRHHDFNWHADWKWRRRYFSNGVELTNLEQQGYDGTPHTTHQPPATPAGHVFRHWQWTNSWGQTGTIGAGFTSTYNNGCRYDAQWTEIIYEWRLEWGTPHAGRVEVVDRKREGSVWEYRLKVPGSSDWNKNGWVWVYDRTEPQESVALRDKITKRYWVPEHAFRTRTEYFEWWDLGKMTAIGGGDTDGFRRKRQPDGTLKYTHDKCIAALGDEAWTVDPENFIDNGNATLTWVRGSFNPVGWSNNEKIGIRYFTGMTMAIKWNGRGPLDENASGDANFIDYGTEWVELAPRVSYRLLCVRKVLPQH